MSDASPATSVPCGQGCKYANGQPLILQPRAASKRDQLELSTGRAPTTMWSCACGWTRAELAKEK